MTWYQHAVAYAEMKWPRLAPHSRASLADTLATVTPLLTRETSRRPPAQTLRAALYGHAFNARRRCRTPRPHTASALACLERASLPVSQLGDPRVIRAALDGLCTRLDGSPAAANTITRKRAVFHGTLGYAVELGLLPANPSAWCAGARPEPPRPSARLLSPARRRSGRSLPRSPALGRNWPRSSVACTARRCAGRSRHPAPRQPHPPVWHAARQAALGPDLAATALARRPYDLRHAALSLWLNASGTPAEVATRGREQRPRPA